MSFENQLVKWYLNNKRELPWRENIDPYRVWISEIILQQTRVVQGEKYFNNFIKSHANFFQIYKMHPNSQLQNINIQ